MIIRKAITEDAETIVDFQLKMALETENIHLDRATVLNGVKAVLADSSKGTYYLAEKDWEVVGSLLITFEWSDWRNGTILWLQSIYVMPEYREQGIYKSLHDHVRNMVDTNEKLKGIRLYADKDNSVAHKVYEKIGLNPDHYILYEWLKE